jgi:hypothetical protein
MGQPFDHELKLRRSLEHLQDLDHVIGPWVEQNHYSVRYDYEPDRKWDGPIPPGGFDMPRGTARYYLAGAVVLPGQPPFDISDAVFGKGVLTAFVTAEQPPRDPVSLLIGDVLHNLRSALDLLAFALASAYTKPLPEEFAERSEFPIFGDEDREGNRGIGSTRFHERTKKGLPTARSGLAKIAGWHPDAQAAVERLQPYQRGNEFRSDPLWLLHELDRVSKHRLLHAGVAVGAGNLLRLEPPYEAMNVRAIGPGLIDSIGGPLDTDTPIARWWGVRPIDPNAEVNMEIHPALQVAFRPEAVGSQDKLVVPTLAELYNHIVGKVIPSVTPYL